MKSKQRSEIHKVELLADIKAVCVLFSLFLML